MDVMKLVKQVVQQLEERNMSQTESGVVIDTMHQDDAFIRLTGQRVDLHARNDLHFRLNGEAILRGQFRLLGSPDQFRVGALHQFQTQLLSFQPSTGVSPLSVLVPHNPIGQILQLLAIL